MFKDIINYFEINVVYIESKTCPISSLNKKSLKSTWVFKDFSIVFIKI